MLAEIQPGKTAVILPSRAADDAASDARLALLLEVVVHLRTSGVRLAQALLETDHGPDAELFAACGFRHAADLLYLVSVSSAFPSERPADGSLTSSVRTTTTRDSHTDRADLCRIARLSGDRTSSLDRRRDRRLPRDWRPPALADRRVRARRSRLFAAGRACAAMRPSWSTWEWCPRLAGGGLAWRWRGTRSGCRAAGRARMILAVDADNTPAIDVYAACGFVGWDRRSVFVLALPVG